MGDMVGFNPELVVSFNKELNNLFEQSRSIFDYYIHNIYELITYSWYAPEANAKDYAIRHPYFEIDAMMYILDRKLRIMANDALKNWCDATQTDKQNYPMPLPNNFECPYANGNISDGIMLILPFPSDRKLLRCREDGFMGIISENISIIKEHISLYQRLMLELLDYYKELYVRHQDMFLGGPQMSTFEYTLNGLYMRVRNTISMETSKLVKMMQETGERYQSTAQANAQLFSSSN